MNSKKFCVVQQKKTIDYKVNGISTDKNGIANYTLKTLKGGGFPYSDANATSSSNNPPKKKKRKKRRRGKNVNPTKGFRRTLSWNDDVQKNVEESVGINVELRFPVSRSPGQLYLQLLLKVWINI